MVQIIYTAKPKDGAPIGSLFAGKKLFLTQKTPSRSHFIDLIKANGGEVVKLEKSADIIIADDARKEVVPGSYSYKWIDNSIKNGALEDLDAYLAGPPAGAPRAVGSVVRPAKHMRNGYTAEDDRVLSEWVQAQAQKGAAIAGNETYKQLEAQNPRHSWQSWRDRWVKTLRFRTSLPPIPREAALAPRDVNSSRSPVTPKSRTKKVASPKPALEEPTDAFTEEEIYTLRALTPTILDIHPERKDEAWNEWAQLHPEHSAQRWRTFWERNILPMARHSSGEIIIEEEESPSRESTPITSPSFHTQSSHVVQKISPAARQIKAEVTTPSKPLLKRKRPADERDSSNIPSSPPVVPRELSLTAYSPYKKRALQMQEVPSTPESDRYIANKALPSQIDLYVKDTLDETDHQSIEVDDYLGNGREVTPTLSEPRTSRKSSTPHRKLGSPLVKVHEDSPKDEVTIKYPRLQSSALDATDSNTVLSLDGEHDETGYIANTQITYPALPQPGGQADEDTQAILRQEPPTFDFDIPEPEEGWQAFQSSPPPMPSSSKRSKGKGKKKAKEDPKNREPNASDDDDEEGFAELSAWMNEKLARGYPMAHIQKALTATTMDLDLADALLECLRSTGDIPTRARGIWTPSDDEKLASQDARDILALQKKHGDKGLDQRWEFLQTYRAVQNERGDRGRSF